MSNLALIWKVVTANSMVRLRFAAMFRLRFAAMLQLRFTAMLQCSLVAAIACGASPKKYQSIASLRPGENLVLFINADSQNGSTGVRDAKIGSEKKGFCHRSTMPAVFSVLSILSSAHGERAAGSSHSLELRTRVAPANNS